MVDIVVTGHGGREVGAFKGTYVVPKGVTIYFFTNDNTVLYAGASDKLMDNLCRNHPNPLRVQGAAVEIKREFEIIPNYICYGTDDFRDPSGAYEVGRRRNLGPTLPIPNNTQKYLSDIIGGAGGRGVIGSNIYWLCCRAAPDNSNNIDDNSDIVTGMFRGKPIGAVEVGSSTGLTPSQVRNRGGNWR